MNARRPRCAAAERRTPALSAGLPGAPRLACDVTRPDHDASSCARRISAHCCRRRRRLPPDRSGNPRRDVGAAAARAFFLGRQHTLACAAVPSSGWHTGAAGRQSLQGWGCTCRTIYSAAAPRATCQCCGALPKTYHFSNSSLHCSRSSTLGLGRTTAMRQRCAQTTQSQPTARSSILKWRSQAEDATASLVGLKGGVGRDGWCAWTARS